MRDSTVQQAFFVHQAFLSNLADFCGQMFVGESTFPEEEDHVLVGNELHARISRCEEGRVDVDLYREGGTVWHTTWVLTMRGDGVQGGANGDFSDGGGDSASDGVTGGGGDSASDGVTGGGGAEPQKGGLHLYHEHIGDKVYPEGEAPLTGYGGYADGRGSEWIQYFPADEATAEMLPEAATNEWRMELDPESGVFVYALERHGKPRFRASLQVLR
jgi:hypothetical protein